MQAVTDLVPALDELDADTLTDLLRRDAARRDRVDATALTVTSVRREPVGAGTGFLGELRRLHLGYSPDTSRGDNTPRTLVAKAPTSSPGGRQVGLMLNVWEREHRFFAELAPQVLTRVPRCYANLADTAASRWLLLLEDAGDSTAPTQVQGAGRAQAESALAEIATLHRSFSSGRPNHWIPGFDRGPFSALQAAVQAAVTPFLTRFGDLLPAGTADVLRRFAPRLSSWVAEQGESPLSVVHADFRLDNLIINAQGAVTVLDWQTALMGDGAMDVASLLATSLTIENRRAWEDDLLAGYADASGRPRAEIRLAVRHHLLWWMALYANNLSRLDQSDPQAAELSAHTVRRTFTAAADHQVGQLLDARS